MGKLKKREAHLTAVGPARSSHGWSGARPALLAGQECRPQPHPSYCTLMLLLLEKFLPVLSHAFTVSRCVPLAMGTSVSISEAPGE